MKKSKSRRVMLAALTGLLVLAPVQSAYMPQTVQAGQVSSASDSRLSDFDIAPGTLNPAFSPDVLQYTATVDADVTSVSVRAVPRSSSGTIASVEGARSLRPGVNTIKVTCSAHDFTTTVYTITVTVGSVGGTQQPETDGAGLQQPDAGTDPQPDSGSSDAQQPDAGVTGTQQPETDPSNAQQPDAGSSDAQQPDAGSTDGTSSDAGGEGTAQPDAGSTNKQKKKKKKKALAALIGTVASDGTVTLNGASYRLSNNFNYGSITQDIPAAFGQGSVQIQGTDYSTLHCEEGGMNLVYMENTDGNGSTGFYFYDEVSNVVERFKYDGTGDHFVVWISTARSDLPEGFQQTVLKLPSGKEVAAYQNKSLDEMRDYYLIYGMYSGGGNGWYLYDNAQNNYLRYVSAFTANPQQPDGEEEEVARTVSLVKYNSLNEKYTQLKKNNVRIVSILAIAMVLIIIVFTAILLRSREEAEEASEGSRLKKSPRQRRAKREEPMSKSSLAAGRDFESRTAKNAKKVTKTITKASEREPEQRGLGRGSLSRQEDVAAPEEIRAQISREKNASLERQKNAAQQRPYEQKRKEQQLYEQRVKEEQQLYEQKLKEEQQYAQKLKEEQLYEQKRKEPESYKQGLKEQQSYERQMKEPQSYEQSLKKQQVKEQQTYEQKLKEQQAYEQKLKEQQAYEQKLKEQQAYEQKLREQQAYEQQPEARRVYEAQSHGSGGMQQKGYIKRDSSSGSADSVQLAAENMRQSMKFTRKNTIEQQEHDPMDDWEVEPVSRRNQKSGRKKRSLAQEDMEIMDLNDL